MNRQQRRAGGRMNQALPVNDSTVAHKLVAETAAAMAHELYDALMQRDDWWKQWQAWHPGQTRKEMEDSFVRRNVAQLLPKARAVLAGMLAGPLNEGLKETIMEALTLDASLQRDTVH